MPDVHAVLGASSAHRWMNCPGSVVLNMDREDKGSQYAREGTLAHALAELVINYNLGNMTKAEYRKRRAKLEEDELYSLEMDEHIKDYTQTIWELVNEAKAQCPDPLVLTEQRLDFSEWVPDGFGTGDVVIIYNGVAHVIDLKYGKGVGVSAEENPQLMLYGLGALNAYDMLYGIDTVRMTIIQPRLDNISTFEVYADDLLGWGDAVVRPKALAALEEDAPCVAGDWCRWCKAKAICRARSEAMLDLAKMEFKDPRLLDDGEIGEILGKADQLIAWAGDVKDYALAEAEKGKKWDGWKLVEGRSNRKYADEAAIVKALTGAGYDEALLYESKLYSITAMEKIVGKKALANLCNAYIIKPPGKPTLVPESDKRPELNTVNSAKDDFKED